MHQSDYVYCDRYFVYKLEYLGKNPVVMSNKYLTVTHISEEAVKEIYRSSGQCELMIDLLGSEDP